MGDFSDSKDNGTIIYMSFKMRGGNQLIDAIKVLEKGGIKEGSSIIDLGCGATGHFVFPAAHLTGPKGTVYAVDLLRSVLDSLESRKKMEGLDNVEIVWADLEKPKAVVLPEHSMDLVLIVNTLGQVGEKEILVKEAARLIKSDGTLILADWKMSYSPLGPPVDKRFSPDDANQLAVKEGFQLNGKFDPGPYHWGMIFKK